MIGKELDNLDNLLSHLRMWMIVIDIIRQFDNRNEEFHIMSACRFDYEHLDWRSGLSYSHVDERNLIYLRNDLHLTAEQWGFKLK